MGGAMRRNGVRRLARGAAVAAFGLAVASCGAVQNMMPEPGDFHLPNPRNYAPTQVSSYARPVTASEQVTAADLVDAQGSCPGVAPTAPGPASGVALEMTECQVVRALGPPQQAEIDSAQPGARGVTLTYVNSDRSGIYRFVNGRLATIDRGAEPDPPPVTKKPAAKKPKQPPAPPA
jgi:hypothetical protein